MSAGLIEKFRSKVIKARTQLESSDFEGDYASKKYVYYEGSTIYERLNTDADFLTTWINGEFCLAHGVLFI